MIFENFDEKREKLREDERFRFIEDEIEDEELLVHHAYYENNTLPIEGLINVYTKRGLFSAQIKVILKKR